MSASNDQMHDWNRKTIEEFRANAGKVGGNFAGAPLLLLHTIGARSGQERIKPDDVPGPRRRPRRRVRLAGR